MHIVASLTSILLLTLAFGVIGVVVAPRRVQMFEALMGRNPVALDSVTFLNYEPRVGSRDQRRLTRLAKSNSLEVVQSGTVVSLHSVDLQTVDFRRDVDLSPAPLSLAA